MKKTKTIVNKQKISIGIKIIVGKVDFKAIANVNFGWYEVVGFRINFFDGNSKKGYQKPRREDCLTVQPPKYGQTYTPAFRTSVAIPDVKKRELVRKKLWYQLEDTIIEAYFKALESREREDRIPDDYEYSDEEIELDDGFSNENTFSQNVI